METEKTELQRSAIAWHFCYNIKPAIPLEFMDAAIAAIEAVNGGDPAALITLDARLNIDGRRELPAWEILEFMHLEDMAIEKAE